MKKFLIIFFVVLVEVCAGQNPQWLVYTPQNSGLPDFAIGTLAFDEVNHCMWIGTGQGVAKFDWQNWTVYDTVNSGLPENSTLTIAIDNENNKWIGTIGGGIAKFDGINWTVYDTNNSPLPDNRIWNIFIDEYDTKWIGTQIKGLVKFNGIEWYVYNTGNSGLPQNTITSGIAEGNIKWIGSYSKGLAKFNDTNWVVYNSTNSGLSYDRITDIDIDDNGIKWISTFGGGLNKFNSIDSSWSNYLNQGFVECLVIAKQTKWIGSPGGGLYKFYNDTGLVNYRPENSPMPSYTVNALSLDSNGNLWIGTNGGVAVFNENGIVGIDDPKIINVPVSAKLYQNYPNPFNPVTKIKYEIKEAAKVLITVYDINGKLISTLFNNYQSSGEYEVEFTGNNIPSGAYFYKLETDKFNETRRMILIK